MQTDDKELSAHIDRLRIDCQWLTKPDWAANEDWLCISSSFLDNKSICSNFHAFAQQQTLYCVEQFVAERIFCYCMRKLLQHSPQLDCVEEDFYRVLSFIHTYDGVMVCLEICTAHGFDSIPIPLQWLDQISNDNSYIERNRAIVSLIPVFHHLQNYVYLVDKKSQNIHRRNMLDVFKSWIVQNKYNLVPLILSAEFWSPYLELISLQKLAIYRHQDSTDLQSVIDTDVALIRHTSDEYFAVTCFIQLHESLIKHKTRTYDVAAFVSSISHVLERCIITNVSIEDNILWRTVDDVFSTLTLHDITPTLLQNMWNRRMVKSIVRYFSMYKDDYDNLLLPFDNATNKMINALYAVVSTSSFPCMVVYEKIFCHAFVQNNTERMGKCLPHMVFSRIVFSMYRMYTQSTYNTTIQYVIVYLLKHYPNQKLPVSTIRLIVSSKMYDLLKVVLEHDSMQHLSPEYLCACTGCTDDVYTIAINRVRSYFDDASISVENKRNAVNDLLQHDSRLVRAFARELPLRFSTDLTDDFLAAIECPRHKRELARSLLNEIVKRSRT